MICVASHLQPCRINTFTFTGTEVACCTLTLPNASHMQVIALYRSLSVPLQGLTTTLHRILAFASTVDIPTIVLGDFNEDILSQRNSSIVSLMSTHGYTQLVTSPTTDRGTFIDHVYYNRPSSTIVQVHDTYSSDHDAVYCSIPA